MVTGHGCSGPDQVLGAYDSRDDCIKQQELMMQQPHALEINYVCRIEDQKPFATN